MAVTRVASFTFWKLPWGRLIKKKSTFSFDACQRWQKENAACEREAATESEKAVVVVKTRPQSSPHRLRHTLPFLCTPEGFVKDVQGSLGARPWPPQQPTALVGFSAGFLANVAALFELLPIFSPQNKVSLKFQKRGGYRELFCRTEQEKERSLLYAEDFPAL